MNHGCSEFVERRGGGILEFGRHDVAVERQPPQRSRVVVCGDEMLMSHRTRRSGRIGIEHDGAIAHRRGCHHGVAPELASAEHTDRRRWVHAMATHRGPSPTGRGLGRKHRRAGLLAACGSILVERDTEVRIGVGEHGNGEQRRFA